MARDVPDEATLALLQELEANPMSTGPSPWVGRPLPFHPVVFSKGDLQLSFFSMITTVGAPIDVTAQELRIEAFFPADAETDFFARRNFSPN